MIDYKWAVVGLMTVPQEAGFSDVVTIVQWSYTGTEEGYSATVGGSSTYGVTQGQSFTPFDQLTEEEVVGWVKSSITPQQLNGLQIAIQRGIDAQKNPAPQPEPRPLPWTGV